MESWKKIPVAPDYEISDLGNIRRLSPPLRRRDYGTPTPYPNKRGYFYVGLRVNGKPKTFQHHRLVMLAFVGASQLQVNHKNGLKHDNRLANLEYVSAQQNQRHSRDVIRTFAQGSRHWNAKLDEAKVRKIISLHKEGINGKPLARTFGVSDTMIYYIIHGKWWKHVQRGPKAPATR